MIKKLNIKNFAIIESQVIDFRTGLNIIMGETGAGKSLLIDSMLLLAGGRSSTDQIRHGEKKSVIEATFEFPAEHPIFNLLNEFELDNFGTEIIIRREISQKSATRCFINDSPVQVNDLKNFGNLIFDFHDQHQHQSLLNKENHIQIIDNLVLNKSLFDDYQNNYQQLLEINNKLRKTIALEKELREKESFRKFQFEEIKKVDPKENEDTELEHELQILENSEFILEKANEINYELYSKDSSVYEILNRLIKNSQELAKYDESFNEYAQELNTALISITEVAKYAGDFTSEIEFSPDKAESIRLRLKELKNLQKKYGSIEAILNLKNELESQLKLTENFQEEIKRIEEEYQTQFQMTFKSALLLSQARKETSINFSNSIVESLKNLGIENGMFDVKFNSENIANGLTGLMDGNKIKINENGFDSLEFMISTNKGESLKPLSDVASGGEISRVMLAIKSIIADISDVPVMIFDEIDSGISGRIAQKAGIMMKKLASARQIIAITHLPQIAALADNAIFVRKSESDSRTFSEAKSLEINELEIEVAKLLSGEDVSPHHINSAKLLMNIENNEV